MREMNVVYLGQSVELKEMKCFANKDSQNIFISNFTVAPESRKTEDYLMAAQQELLQGTNNKFFVSCSKVQASSLYEEQGIHIFNRIPDLIEALDNQVILEQF